MPTIKVNTNQLSSYESDMQGVLSRVNSIMNQFNSVSRNLDWDIKAESNINSRLSGISRELSAESRGISGMKQYLGQARTKYNAVERKNSGKRLKNETTGTGKAVGIRTKNGKVVTTAANVGAGTKSKSSVKKAQLVSSKTKTGKKSNLNVSFDKDWFSYFDLKSAIKDSAKAGGQILNAIKKGFFTSGFKVVRDKTGQYVIAKGATGARTALKDSFVENIKGTRYKVGSAKYNSSGIARFDPGATALTKVKASFKVNFSGFAKDTYGIFDSAGKANLGAIAGYAAIAYDTVTHAVGNYKNGAAKSKIAADATVDVAKGLGEMAVVSAGAKAGAAIGTLIPIPVVGTLVGGVVGGAVAGFAYSYAVDGGIKIGGKSIAENASSLIEKGIKSVGNAVSGNGKSKAVKSASKKVTNNNVGCTNRGKGYLNGTMVYQAA